MPPQAASTYVAHSSGRDGREYRRPTAYTAAGHDVPRYGHAYQPAATRTRRKSSPSVDKEYRQNRVSTGLTSSSEEVDSEDDDDDSDESDGDVIVTISNTRRRRRDTIVPQPESDDDDDDSSSPTRGRGHRERYGESSEDDDPRGAELRTPSTSSRDEDISPSTKRTRRRLIEAAPAQSQSHRPRVASDVVEQQNPRSTRRSSRRTEPVVLQQRVSPRKVRREPSHSDSSRLSSIVSGGAGTHYHADQPRVKVRPAMPARVTNCLSCNTDQPVEQVSRLQCGHKMCESCLKHKFELACKNPQYMPPTCCTDEAIPYDYVEPLFDTLFKKAFYRTSRDAATPSRLYCPSRSCGEHFVPKLVKSDGVRNSTRCDVCNQKICLSCNSKWHTAPDCQAEAAGPNHARHPRDAGRQRCPPSITTTGNKQYYADRNVADEESESDDDPPVRQFAGRRDARPRVYHAEPTRQRKVQDNYDEDLARQMELDMALEDTDDDNEEYDITVGRVDRDGLGISSGRRRNTHYSHSSGRNRTQPRESPPVHEPGYKTPPRSVYDRGNYVSETGRARGLRSDSFREGSMERRLAQRLSEPRPNAGPPMGFPPGPPHGGPAGMMPQGVPPPPMGPTPYHQPHQMRMPLGSVPLTSSPPMMSSPPHPFGSFPPHPSQAIHYQPPPARSMMSDYDHGGSPRSSTGPRSSSMAGLSSHGGEGKSRVHEWRRHVDVGVAAHEEYTVPATIPEERMISG